MDNKVELETLLLNLFRPQTVKNCIVQPLSSKEQLFTSCIHKVNVTLENNNKNSQVDLIIKILSSKENDLECNLKLKFQKEIDFYQLALPEYHRIHTINNLPVLNLFPVFYTASEDLIVLKDLHTDGYCVCDSFLNEEQCKLVLQELAKFHATGIALKRSNHKIFEEQLASVAIPALRNASNPNRDEVNDKFKLKISKLIRSNHVLEDFAESVDLLLTRIDNTKLPTSREPFSTLLHNDLWRGNIMFKYTPISGQLADVKFIDFQTTIFNSPARDIIYFLFSSVEEDVLSNFHDLLKIYHHCFVNCLSNLGCDSSEFTFDKFMLEVNTYGPSKLKHILQLFKVQCSGDDGNRNFGQHLQRVLFLFRERGWV